MQNIIYSFSIIIILLFAIYFLLTSKLLLQNNVKPIHINKYIIFKFSININ